MEIRLITNLLPTPKVVTVEPFPELGVRARRVALGTIVTLVGVVRLSTKNSSPPPVESVPPEPRSFTPSNINSIVSLILGSNVVRVVKSNFLSAGSSLDVVPSKV